MAKKIITLEKIVELIEDTVKAEQQIIDCKCKDDNSEFKVIADKEYAEVPYSYINDEDEFEFSESCNSDKVHCILLNTDLFDYKAEHPFMLADGAANGILSIDGKVPTIEELNPYLFILD